MLPAAGFACAAEPAKLVETVCRSCHSLEIVTKKQATRDEWRDVAPLTDEEFSMVVDYLAKT